MVLHRAFGVGLLPAANGPRTPGEMGETDDYLLRVRQTLELASNWLSRSEEADVANLIDHGEPAEAMRTGAWIIIDDVKLFPGEVVTAVRELASGLVDEICMPPDLDSHVESIDG
jgi:hypothetical protein